MYFIIVTQRISTLYTTYAFYGSQKFAVLSNAVAYHFHLYFQDHVKYEQTSISYL